MNNSTTNITKQDVILLLSKLQQNGSFGDEYYPTIDKLVAELGLMKRKGEIADDDIAEIRYFFGQDFLENTLHGMALLKKYGYAGDFLMIDKIYTGITPHNPFFQSWDQYFQNHAAHKAVRNRKTYFKQLVHKKLAMQNAVRLLNVASGPGRDLLELYNEKLDTKKLYTQCVEMDSHAIAYAENLTKEYSEQIQFINKNVFKFDTEEKFDMIWSAGLFDYFDNKAFVFILKKFKQWVVPHGEIVIGNFNQQHNPTREYMELFGNWYLHHRTKNELIGLAIEAGFNEHQLTVGNEEENVNLFLHIQIN